MFFFVQAVGLVVLVESADVLNLQNWAERLWLRLLVTLRSKNFCQDLGVILLFLEELSDFSLFPLLMTVFFGLDAVFCNLRVLSLTLPFLGALFQRNNLTHITTCLLNLGDKGNLVVDLWKSLKVMLIVFSITNLSLNLLLRWRSSDSLGCLSRLLRSPQWRDAHLKN